MEFVCVCVCVTFHSKDEINKLPNTQLYSNIIRIWNIFIYTINISVMYWNEIILKLDNGTLNHYVVTFTCVQLADSSFCSNYCVSVVNLHDNNNNDSQNHDDEFWLYNLWIQIIQMFRSLATRHHFIKKKQIVDTIFNICDTEEVEIHRSWKLNKNQYM